MKRLTCLAMLGIALTVPNAVADPAKTLPSDIEATAEALMAQAQVDKTGLKFVEDLTTEIGQRLAGSAQEALAREWAVAELTELGFDNVHVEPFEIPFWSRVSEEVSITAPSQQAIVATALGGSAATPPGGVEGDVVRFENMAELRGAEASAVAGRIVFVDEGMTRTMDGSGYGMAVRKRSECASVSAEKGALACLIRSVGTQTHRMPHTGIMARTGAEGAGPVAAISSPDADQLTRLLERGKVSVKVDIQTETRTNAPSGNVIAEVTGSGLKHEIVLISCHLDSWDLGTGALDDGAGCGIVVAAAKLIADLPEPPRRTIRVVLYGAEEVGLFGGAAYARTHSEDLVDHILAAESDFGAGPIWRFQTRFGDTAYASVLHKLLAPLGVTPGNNEAFGGPDIGVLARSGVPVVSPNQNGMDYFDYHHTPDDTFDKVDPESFRQNVAVYAAFTYVAAQTGWDFRAAADAPVGTQ
ncbi:MAG: M28 family peptidase [Alphaproteobacteria bacterium]|nr:M28 family peptidase [Alphaproteobacteria bacterium]